MLWLVGQLPDDSAFAASLAGGAKYRPWTLERRLQAATVNLLYAANSQRAGKRSKPLITPPKPRKARQQSRVVRVADVARKRRVAGR